MGSAFETLKAQLDHWERLAKSAERDIQIARGVTDALRETLRVFDGDNSRKSFVGDDGRALYPHQKRGARKTLECLRNDGAKTRYIAACGTGKTLVAAHVRRQLNTQRMLFCAPTLALLRQAAEEVLSVTHNLKVAFVCSDDTVGEGMGQNLAANALSADAVFSTYASWHWLEDQDFDLIVYDEAHHTAGDPGSRAALAASHWTGRKLFMTATPRIVSDDTCISMDDESVYGPVADTYLFDEAIQDGRLSDYEVIVVGAEAAMSGGVKPEDLHGVHLKAIKRAIRDERFRTAISFHPRRAMASAFASALSGAGIQSLFVDSELLTIKREQQIMNALASDGAVVLCNCFAISEGFDLPAVDGAVLTYKKSSTTDLVQSIGRALRLDKDNPDKIAKIVIPVPIPMAGEALTAEEVYGSDGWQIVRRALSALAAFDYRAPGATNQGGQQHKGLTFDFDGHEFEGQIDLAVATAFGQRGASDFFRVHRAYLNGERIAGKGLPYALARSVSNLRTSQRLGDLPISIAAALESLDGWSWDQNLTAFQIRLESLAAYCSAHDGKLPPGDYKDATGESIGEWVETVLACKRAGILPKKEQEQLEDVSNEWPW